MSWQSCLRKGETGLLLEAGAGAGHDNLPCAGKIAVECGFFHNLSCYLDLTELVLKQRQMPEYGQAE